MTSQPPARTVFLVFAQGEAAGQHLAVCRNLWVIGRDEDADLTLSDLAISRHHVLLIVDPDGAVSLRDLGSANGTRVNGQRLTAERALVEGDEIAIGAITVLRLTYEPPSR